MSMHPTIAAALAEQHHREMITRAEAHRTARAARASRPAPPRPAQIIPQLAAAARRTVTRLLPSRTAATTAAGSQS
jgi:hypothetical protein